jgi:hypothetical protein
VGIDEADSAPNERLVLDEEKYLLLGGEWRLGQSLQQVQYFISLAKISARQLTDHKRVSQDPTGVQQGNEALIAGTQMIDPDRGIDQDHAEPGRLRGTGFNCPSLPPRRARRRALSRSIKARKPSLTKAVFSATPVIRRASFSKSSSIFTVVRIYPAPNGIAIKNSIK